MGKALLVLAAGVLLVALGVIVFDMEDRVTPEADDWFVLVRTPEGNSTRVYLGQLESWGNTTVSMALLGTGEDGRPHSYKGTLIRDLAERFVAMDFSSVTVRGADTYSKKVTSDQAKDFDVLLAFQKDGKDLKPRAEGGSGPVRLLLPQEAVGAYNAQHCVKWVSEVIFE